MSDEREVKNFPKDEEQGSEDVEAHVKTYPASTDAPSDEGSDDVEAHVKTVPQVKTVP